MTARELLSSAISMVSLFPLDSEGTEDYTERAPYLIATFLNRCAPLDRLYRRANMLGSATAFDGAVFPLDDVFPLSAVFATAATYYLAAMLVLDENEEMSDRFFAMYADELTSIRASLPAVVEPILNKHKI